MSTAPNELAHLVNEVSVTRDHGHTTLVTVNNRAVEVPSPKATGAQIKQAAISAGLPIQPSFVLSQEHPNGTLEIVGDNDLIVVNKNAKFVAVAPDDNS